MKKRFAILGVMALLMVALVVPTAFADKVVDTTDAPSNWFNQMFQYHSQWLDSAEKNGQITPDQADNWRNHFNYMQEFHNQNGYGMMGNGPRGGYGGCWGAQGGAPAPVQPEINNTSI